MNKWNYYKNKKCFFFINGMARTNIILLFLYIYNNINE